MSYRSILIIGGTGSLGKKLIKRYNIMHRCVHVYSRDEAKHWTINNDLKVKGSPEVKFHVGDIRDEQRLYEVMLDSNPEIVIVAAALKQVDTCERTPNESIKTNLEGTQNVINAASKYSLMLNRGKLKILFVSTDKACSPVNVYGMCKSISERLITSQVTSSRARVDWLCTRYGNVLESRGSIIPLFKHQSENADAITITDPNMTRFLMTLDDSVDLIQHTLSHGESGETWIPKIKSMKIQHLAEIFSEISGKPIKVIGQRPGEKMHEDLINESESMRATDKGTHYSIAPSFLCPDIGIEPFTFTSNDPQALLTKEELRSYLGKLGILDMKLEDFPRGPNIEEIIK